MRGSPLDSIRRGYLGLTRGVIMSTDDSGMIQTVDVRGMHGEMLQGIERFQSYGFNSVPLDPDNNGAQGAEPLIGFINGNRSHAVVLAEGDGRTRPKNWKPGEAGNWHYKGGFHKFTDDGFQHDQGPDKKPYVIVVGTSTLTIADGKATIKVGDSVAAVVKADAVYLGGDPDQGGTFARAMTESGPTNLVKMKVG